MTQCRKCRDNTNFKCDTCFEKKKGTEYKFKDGHRLRKCIGCYSQRDRHMKCKKCKVVKDIDLFDKNSGDEYYSYCSGCRKTVRNQGHRKCIGCKIHKPVVEYDINTVGTDYFTLCKVCRDINEKNKNRKCRQCKEIKDISCFTFVAKNMSKSYRNRTCDSCR